ncbi:MAG TPA: energy transducer TonB [Vicinamibacterales bacterium]|nr:energy transducer TonB [Vicinamibacterales bacterium]
MGTPSGVFSLDEVARAAGVTRAQARTLANDDGLLSGAEAVRLGRALVAARRAATAGREAPLFSQPSTTAGFESHGLPLAFSASLHVAVLTTIVLALGFRTTAATRLLDESAPPVRLIFLATPGLGGGGGGGGRLQNAPPPRAQLEGRNAIASPVPPPRPAPSVQEKPREAPPEAVVAPIASAPDDNQNRSGVLQQVRASDDSNGSGRGGGAGTGSGSGLGEGDGAGVGPGNGGGFGGGAYRPGSGITPPRVVREVKADYTEEARRRGLTGEVVMEIVIRRDGSVGDVQLLKGLGLGLDERAIAAVRQWQFTPAERQGVPVAVIVEVGVEFRLR